ncbi:zinc ribbon domain-containing protein [Candidatus Nitrospira allomarina]|uniref:Zinc ribbon domain-containing protein n=1 Tax=Candidatus Nitrospira allomarina TaxID=3020900 RepID=A0AA96K0J6_9BACT|nr:zinc ribbon domain-containing protein [Candidatus Nitrospira allomarina]WNM59729.1 zinc ribbon domain-containing protein [Candidatus Nitrospira allomarina]
MKCPQCGKNGLAESAQFCSACGDKLPKPKKAVGQMSWPCPNCALELEKPVRECPQCGILVKVLPKAAERASNFVGRYSTLRRIDSWISGNPVAEPALVLTGGAGSGKSALMAWLCGAGPASSDQEIDAVRKRVHKSLDAVHFCIATTSGTSPSLDPARFATKLSEQLSFRIPDYGAWLLANADRQTEINVKQIAESVSGTMIGVLVEHLSGKDPSSIFSAILEPLASIPLPQGQVVILIDALDEAELWPASPTIGELLAGALDGGAEGVAGRVRFVVSTRPVDLVTDRFPREAQWDLIDDAADDSSDVLTYVRARFKRSAPHADPAFAQKFTEASQENFLYAKTALDYWLPRLNQLDPKKELDLLPKLNGIYSSFLQREYGSKEGKKLWKDESKPLLGTLGVAQEKLSDVQLQFILNIDEMGRLQDALQQCDPYLEGDRPNGPFDLYHQSFREFLFDQKHNHKFPLSEADDNARTAVRYLDRYRGDWDKCFDDYGLRHTPTHLAEAARHSRQPKRDDFIQRLISLVGDSEFQKAHEKRLGDAAALQRDLERTLEEACHNDSPVALRLVFDATRELQAFRHQQMDPKQVFEAAEAGDLDRAEKLLEIFFAEPHWHRASLLVAVWLAAAGARRDAAQSFFARLEDDPLDIRPLPTLSERVSDALSDTPPERRLTDLIPQDHPELIQQILQRMRGLNADEEVLASELDPNSFADVQEQLDQLDQRQQALVSQLGEGVDPTVKDREGTSYLGGIDGPHLVAYSLADSAKGDDSLSEYVQLLAANGYVFYRNRSLWGLFCSILRHPKQNWVKQFSRLVCEAALAGSRVRFAEGVPIAQRVIEKAKGKPKLRPMFDELLVLAKSRASELEKQPGRGLTEPSRGRGDTWGHYKRLLGILAEALSVVIGDTEIASNLVDLALDRPSGFAGYESPACLALAESALIAGPGAEDRIHKALQRASESAHCVQDPPFCARTTSRYNALAHEWRDQISMPVQATELAKRIDCFLKNPYAAEFGAVHIVGEAYLGRANPPVHLEIPSWAQKAATLRDLARFYERTLADFVRLNREDIRRADEILPIGTEVRVPDPEMSYLLASYLSALVIVTPGLDTAKRTRLIQSLVPMTVSSPTAIDTVLARLLLVARPDDPELFARLPDELKILMDDPGSGYREALMSFEF